MVPSDLPSARPTVEGTLPPMHEAHVAPSSLATIDPHGATLYAIDHGGQTAPHGHDRARADAPDEFAAGDVLAERYRLVGRLGAGGMGDVWEAQHVVVGRPVAIKVLAASHGIGDEAATERLIREAQAIGRIEHDNVIDILDCGRTHSGATFIVMELLRGETLAALVAREGPLPWSRVGPIARELASALATAHANGVIHRDVKPANVIIVPGKDGLRCKLIDFGIAKLTSLGPEGVALTKTGMVFGTPAYMSPEQAHGRRVDERTDVYSLGGLVHFLLAGRGPFDAPTPAEVLYRHLYVEAPALRSVVPTARVPEAVEAIVLRCLRKDPALRFQTMTELEHALAGVESTAPITQVPIEQLAAPPAVLQARWGDATLFPSVDTAPPLVVAPSVRRLPTPAEPSAASGRARGVVGMAAIGTLAAGVVVGAFLVFGPGQDTPAAPTSPTSMGRVVDVGEPEAEPPALEPEPAAQAPSPQPPAEKETPTPSPAASEPEPSPDASEPEPSPDDSSPRTQRPSRKRPSDDASTGGTKRKSSDPPPLDLMEPKFKRPRAP